MRLRRSTLVAAAARRATGEQSERMPQWRSPKEQLSDAGERVATLIHGTRRQNCWLACRCGHAEAVCQNHRMDGVHDLGGMHGFGAIPIEEDEPLYHEPWEGRAAAITRHLMSNTTVDHFRWTIERMPPAEYLASRYNQRWLWAAEQMAAEQGLLDGPREPSPERHDDPWAEPVEPPRFAAGQRVRVRSP